MGYIDDLFNIKGKVVAVTGAMGQLGLRICKAYRDAGAEVVGLDIDTSGKKLKKINYLKADITKKENISLAFEEIIKRFNTFDILINNAGISTFEPFEKRSEKEFDRIMDVNLKGTFLCIQSYVNLFDRHKLKKGSIVNIASIYGVINPDFKIYTDCKRKSSEVYGATKAGIIQMTRYFAIQLADRKIRVNAVSPGGIHNKDNPQGKDFVKNYSSKCPMNRMAEDTEILGAIFYVSSDAANYTTGQNIVIDGGMSCW